MLATKRILVVLDATTLEEQPVLERAAWLAQRVGAELELYACDYDSDIDAGRVSTVWIPEPGAREHLLLRHRWRLDELAKPLRERGLRVTVDVAWDYPLGEAVVRKTVATSPWLVAKDTHHHSLIERTLLTNGDWHLIRNCPVPLLLVKRRTLPAAPKVLAAVDPVHEHDRPAALDDQIFAFASDLACAADAELHVLHAYAMPMGLQLPPEARAMIVQEHRAAMARFLDTHPIPNDRVHMFEGLAHECLQKAAVDTAADFLVMGAVARRGFKRLIIGSTAARVLDRLPCDLVIVKAPDFVVPEDAR